MVLFLPVLPVLNLQMGTGRKVLVLSSFLLGSLYVLLCHQPLSLSDSSDLTGVERVSLARCAQ